MREDVKELVESAEEDLILAKEIIKLGYPRSSSFHAHQSVEKLLKAFILQSKGENLFTHSIRVLLEACLEVDSDFEELLKLKVHTLGRYYVGTRYPPLMKVTEEEAEEAIKLAEKVREFVLGKLNID